MKFAGVVVLYNPSSDLLLNIRSYISYLDVLFVIDNSEVIDIQITQQIQVMHKVIYSPNNRNMGIASALNEAVKKALAGNCDYLLTMDQDSSFCENHFSKFIDLLSTFHKSKISKIGIFSPYHIINNKSVTGNGIEYEPVKVAMTSGNILNLNAFSLTGDFKEELFIDYVDHEYCLRLRKNGYEILQCNKVHLQHNLGNSKHYKLLNITATHHNFIRRYYITRNRLYVIWLYKYFDSTYCGKEFFLLFTDLVKILIVEKDKLRKFRSVIRGMRDFIMNRYGPYQY